MPLTSSWRWVHDDQKCLNVIYWTYVSAKKRFLKYQILAKLHPGKPLCHQKWMQICLVSAMHILNRIYRRLLFKICQLNMYFCPLLKIFSHKKCMTVDSSLFKLFNTFGYTPTISFGHIQTLMYIINMLSSFVRQFHMYIGHNPLLRLNYFVRQM